MSTQPERRTNWKENIGKAAKMRSARRIALIVELDAIREAISQAGIDFERYDELKAQQRQIMAMLVTL